MQLGTRWAAGAPPHASVPQELHAAIAEQEARYPDASSWTLTWLEGRPRCDLAGEVLVTLSSSGEVVVASPAGTLGAEPGHPVVSDVSEDDDDDWLT